MPRHSKHLAVAIFSVALTVVLSVRAEAGVIVESFIDLVHGEIVSADSGPMTNYFEASDLSNGFTVDGLNGVDPNGDGRNWKLLHFEEIRVF